MPKIGELSEKNPEKDIEETETSEEETTETEIEEEGKGTFQKIMEAKSPQKPIDTYVGKPARISEDDNIEKGLAHIKRSIEGILGADITESAIMDTVVGILYIIFGAVFKKGNNESNQEIETKE